MTKLDLLKSISFGRRIAEEEVVELASYFHVTSQYRGVRSGDTEVIYGKKGAGKSAMYVALKNEALKLIDDGVLLVAAENPRGAAAFKEVETEPPATEKEFETLWKLYILTLVAAEIRSNKLETDASNKSLAAMEAAGLVTSGGSLAKYLKAAQRLAKRLLQPKELSGTLEFDGSTGVPTGFKCAILPEEPTIEEEQQGYVSLHEICRTFDEALKMAAVKLWICVDRLDVAFADNEELEANALRALFRTYRDFDFCSQIRMRIFLRSDIWARITSSGFREASHITRHTTIEWSNQDLLSLVVRRIAQSAPLLAEYGFSLTEVRSSFARQNELFYRVFPEKVYSGRNQSMTFDWILSRTSDATEFSAPREILHLLATARDNQIKRLENGHTEPEGSVLIDRQSLLDALYEVSKVRIEQTLFQEYPSLRDDIMAFMENKAEQSLASVSVLWHCDAKEAEIRARKLAEVGFWKVTGIGETQRYKIPFLYRPYLKITRGTVDEDGEPSLGSSEPCANT